MISIIIKVIKKCQIMNQNKGKDSLQIFYSQNNHKLSFMIEKIVNKN
jgi:hypothetical protein